MISPQTDIRLLKCPLTLSNKHQITFANKEAQETYFLSLPYKEDTNASYQRKDNVIRFNAHFDDLIMYSYCMYKNSNYSNKWFYAFITNMRYINDNVTEITILTDVFQTWQFDIIYKQSFIEREIVPKNLDIAGNYLIPEGLEFGELKVDSTFIRNNEIDLNNVFTGDDSRMTLQLTERGIHYTMKLPVVTNGSGIIFKTNIKQGHTYILNFSTISFIANKSVRVAQIRLANSLNFDVNFQTIQNGVQFTANFDAEFLRFYIYSTYQSSNYSNDGEIYNISLYDINLIDESNIEELEPAYIVAYSGDHYIDPDGNSHSVSQEGYSYNGIYSSVTFILANKYGFKNLMRLLNQADNSEKILTVFCIPSLAVKSLLPDDPPRTTHIFL